MMYNNKLAIAVKSNGKVLREFKDTAFIPFGSEYSLLIKNLNTVRVEVRVEIDGTDATDGSSLVIMPNSEIELKRFIKNGNLNEGNAFKFIERTSGIEQHRGVGVEDGLIRVEYQFEKVQPAPVYIPPGRWVKKEIWDYEQPQQYWSSASGAPTKGIGSSILRGMSASSATLCSTAPQAASASYNASAPEVMAQSASYNDAGITVPGKVVDQQFSVAAWFPVEDTKHVMVIKLLGETEAGQVVQQPVTVKAKPKCTTCGHVNKATAKFCSECGTSLVLV
jgi:zinc-ribbon domain